MTDLLKKPTPDQLFILDIDSTLVTTHQRNQSIIEAFILEFHNQFPEDCKALEKAECQLGDYGIESTLQRISFEEKNTGSLEALHAYWRENFFSGRHLHADQPTGGAVDWVQSLNKENIPFVYLTARHHGPMWTGTLKAMAEIQFPINTDNLFLKEDLSDSDETYKTKLISKLKEENPNKTLVLIDNEPVVLNRVAEDHPDVALVWFESCHSGRMQPPSKAQRIKDFY